MSEKKPTADWERIEVDYRAGAKSVREIASEYGVSHTAVQKRSANGEWTRDLRAKVQAAADAKVAKALVATEVAAETKITETLTVEVEATVQARVRLAQRKDIGKGRSLVMALFAELDAQTQGLEDFAKLGELMAGGHDESSEAQQRRKERLKAVFDGAISLPGRADTLKKLADSLRILIDKEREAYGIDVDKGGPADGLAVVTIKDLTGRK